MTQVKQYESSEAISLFALRNDSTVARVAQVSLHEEVAWNSEIIKE
jgi:hypothetical protein